MLEFAVLLIIKKDIYSSGFNDHNRGRHDDLVEINDRQDVRMRQFPIYTIGIVLCAVDEGGMAALIGKVIDGYNTVTYTWAGTCC